MKTRTSEVSLAKSPEITHCAAAAQACGKNCKNLQSESVIPRLELGMVVVGQCAQSGAAGCFLLLKQQGTYIRRANHGKFLQGKIRRCAQA